MRCLFPCSHDHRAHHDHANASEKVIGALDYDYGCHYGDEEVGWGFGCDYG